MDYLALKTNLLNIALKAGEIIVNAKQNGLKTIIKPDNTPVTNADQDASDYIVTALESLYKNVPIISEENDFISDSDINGGFFIIDPLDGTKDFLKGTAQFTVNIGFVENHEIKAGVIYAPDLNDIYYGDIEQGAFYSKCQNHELGGLEKIQVAATGKVRVVKSISYLDNKTQGYIDSLNPDEQMKIGSSLKLCVVAKGGADYYPRLVSISQWDIAAGHAIVKAAGGNVIKENGEELDYGKFDEKGELLKLPPFLAYGALAPKNWGI